MVQKGLMNFDNAKQHENRVVVREPIDRMISELKWLSALNLQFNYTTITLTLGKD
jgi:hypothetical protein